MGNLRNDKGMRRKVREVKDIRKRERNENKKGDLRMKEE